MLLCCFVALLLIRAKRPCTLARLDAPQHTHTHTFTHTHTLSHTCPCTSLCRCLAHRCGRRFVSCCRTTTARRATLLSSHVRCVPTCAAPSPTLLVCCWYLGSSLHYSSPPPLSRRQNLFRTVPPTASVTALGVLRELDLQQLVHAFTASDDVVMRTAAAALFRNLSCNKDFTRVRWWCTGDGRLFQSDWNGAGAFTFFGSARTAREGQRKRPHEQAQA